mmetsp:Transcript_23414/g.17849  ORF Transcript_23414/g.17849 Transcript_23414/m.17849 type:complete len:136 (-) Transcript_23414:1605-2012(-)
MESSLFGDDPSPPQAHASFSQSVMSNEYLFQQSMHYHSGSVRALGCLDAGYLLSGSIDTTAKLYLLHNNTGKYEFERETKYHGDFVYSVHPDISGNGFFTGGKDNKCYLMDLLGNPLGMYEGHEGPVNSISQAFP